MWKVEVHEGDKIQNGHIVAILEAMKLEITVRAEANLHNNMTVEKLLVKPTDVVQAGQPLMLLRTG